MIKERLGVVGLYSAAQSGSRKSSSGIVDLIAMKAIIYKAEDLGAESEPSRSPPDLLGRARRLVRR